MTLTTGGKNFLAQYAGVASGTQYCFSLTGVTYTDPDNVSHTGSTSDVVNAFVLIAMMGDPTISAKPICQGKSYNDFYAANGNTAPALSDVTAVDAESSGASRYCYTPAAQTGTLSVSTTPTGATVTVPGYANQTTPFSLAVAPGTYALTISKTGYVPQTDSVTVTANTTTTKSYTLVSVPTGTLSATSSPTGATVEITQAGTPIGTHTTPFSVTLNTGTYTLVISKLGYASQTDTVTIQQSTTTSKTWTLSAGETCELWLNTDPVCCQAWVDVNPDVTPTPTVTCTKGGSAVDKISVAKGVEHTVYVRKTGYKNWQHTFEALGPWYYAQAALEPAAGTKQAQVTVNAYKAESQPSKVAVPDAIVRRGTTFMGICPYTGFWEATDVGKDYTVNLSAPGRAETSKAVKLVTNVAQTLDVYMSAEEVRATVVITTGTAYIAELGGSGSVGTNTFIWYCNNVLKEVWARIETAYPRPMVFNAELVLVYQGTTNPVPGISKLVMPEKIMHPGMSADERHLECKNWAVPDESKKGKYDILATLWVDEVS